MRRAVSYWRVAELLASGYVAIGELPSTGTFFRVWPNKLVRGAILAPLLALALVSAGYASNTWTVCASGCDFTTIAAAIATPTTASGDTISVLYSEDREAGITVDKNLIIQGQGVVNTSVGCSVCGEPFGSYVFTVSIGVTATIQDMRIVGPSSLNVITGGEIDNGGTLAINNAEMGGFFSPRGGTGISNGGVLKINNSTISGNTSRLGIPATAILNGGTLTITGSTISGNATLFHIGPAVYNVGTTVITNSVISYNTGGIQNDGELTIDNSTLSNNASAAGGAIYNDSGASVTISNSIVSANTAEVRYGGAILNGGELAITNSTFSGNSAIGSIFVPGGESHGGAIVNAGELAITNSTFSGNVLNSSSTRGVPSGTAACPL